MKASLESPARRLWQTLLHETDESATVGLFLTLCRTSRELRDWLWESFAREPELRAGFARLLGSPARAATRFVDLDGDGSAWRHELDTIRARFATPTYGGLSFTQLKELLVRHQAGQVDPAAFLLALEWRRQRKSGKISPRLMLAAFTFLDAALAPGGEKILQDLSRAVELTAASGNRERFRAAIGFSDWWKLNLLLYILRHPAPSYRTRDLLQHLSTQGLQVSSRAIRQFCTAHAIARDMRAGRPRPRPTAAAHPQRGPARSARRRAGQSSASNLHRP